MIITCPECKTNFIVPNEAIKKEGRKVKCSKCSHNWLFVPGTKVEEPEEKPQLTEQPIERIEESQVRLPALPYYVHIPKILYINPVIMLLLICLTLVISFPSIVDRDMLGRDFCEASSVCSTKGIKIRNIKHEFIENKDHSFNLFVNYEIANTTNKNMPIPELVLELVDNGENMLTHEQRRYNTEIKPSEVLKMHSVIANIPEETDQLVIKLGNKIEMLTR